MVKKRNRRTRKKYKKRGGFTDEELKDCNDRLEKQGVKGMVKRRKMCVKSNAKAGLPTQEPAPVQPVQPIAQPKEPTELKQSSGVQSVIAPLEVESPAKPSIKDRASALEKKFGKTGMRKTRKALKTTIGACRAAVDEKGRKYYYNEANEVTWDPNDEVCHPKEGIEKTGNISGDCIGARYKGGEEYWYHPKKQFSTHDKNHPLCHENDEIKAEDIKIPKEPNLSLVRLIKPKKVEEKKGDVECSELSNTKCKKNDSCELVTNKIKGKSNNKKNKVKKCLPKKKGGKRTKRKKSRKKRKKSRKRRR